MKTVSAAALRKRRRRLLHQLPPLEPLLRGSLIERYKRCGRPLDFCQPILPWVVMASI